MLVYFIKTNGYDVAINSDFVVSVAPATDAGMPCTQINGSDKQYWNVKDTYAEVVAKLNYSS